MPQNFATSAEQLKKALSATMPTPRVLEDTEIRDLIERFAYSARLAMDAGYDAIELHDVRIELPDAFDVGMPRAEIIQRDQETNPDDHNTQTVRERIRPVLAVPLAMLPMQPKLPVRQRITYISCEHARRATSARGTATDRTS